MKELDKVETFARYLATDDTGDTNEREWILSRFIVVALPLCRAAVDLYERAERNADLNHSDIESALHDHVVSLRAALETL